MNDLIHIVNDLEARGVNFTPLTEFINTSRPVGKLLFHMFAALPQFIREGVRERTVADLAAARAHGRKCGRPPLLITNGRRLGLLMVKNREMSVEAIAEHLGVSRSPLYNLHKSRSQVISQVVCRD